MQVSEAVLAARAELGVRGRSDGGEAGDDEGRGPEAAGTGRRFGTIVGVARRALGRSPDVGAREAAGQHVSVACARPAVNRRVSESSEGGRRVPRGRPTTHTGAKRGSSWYDKEEGTRVGLPVGAGGPLHPEIWTFNRTRVELKPDRARRCPTRRDRL